MTSSHPLSVASLFSVKGWIAVVTGGGTGLGLTAAKTLAANGAKVYITGRRIDVLETSARIHGAPENLGANGGSIVPIAMDVTSKESIKAAVDTIIQKDGHVNLLVNNAGMFAGRAESKAANGAEAYGDAMFAESIDDGWQKSYLTNCTSIYFVTAAFLPLLAKASSSPSEKVGSVINISSVSGLLKISQDSQYSYNCSKAATTHLTRQMALELSHENINICVNGIAPGYFPSEMTAGPSGDDNQSSDPGEPFRHFMSTMGAKVKRMGRPEELASVILTLATNEYIWGAIVPVDGGFLLQMPGVM
ncbi:uncharacterized protein BCR38DRAFT_450651 [Pseudomassariella vexata]|uniref:NAD(P)-binding protein n=1 Tax=Pseudomassariella vexata TaxID=1141098 RepID=A0A1Y2DBR0_9PEZI|nr:uncharacterized protein BCR38DRAFT_450651 [Pseudomassariella vexata]ORY56584.1 hypothetical protein BCR38DRAFT_450651 [Pseudomassariella vexata]